MSHSLQYFGTCAIRARMHNGVWHRWPQNIQNTAKMNLITWANRQFSMFFGRISTIKIFRPSYALLKTAPNCWRANFHTPVHLKVNAKKPHLFVRRRRRWSCSHWQDQRTWRVCRQRRSWSNWGNWSRRSLVRSLLSCYCWKCKETHGTASLWCNRRRWTRPADC